MSTVTKKLSKASMKKLKESEFFHEIEETVKAWDYYCRINDIPRSNEMMHKWEMAKLALEYITGNLYGFSRDMDGNYSIVNERDYSDRPIVGRNEYGGN